MNYEDYIKNETQWLSEVWASKIVQETKDKETRIRIWSALESLGIEPGGNSTHIFRQRNFQLVVKICDALEAIGVCLENITVEDRPEDLQKIIIVKLPSREKYYIYVALARDAECELIEVSREPQPDKIIYEMRCPQSPVIEDGEQV